MSLVKSPTLTARKLAANRANAQKSSGPRTRRGKARMALNALKHGRSASRLFRTHLVVNREEVGLYDWIYDQIRQNLRPRNKAEWADAEDLAREVWCFFRAQRPEPVRQAMPEGRRLPRRSSIWCLLRIPTRLTGGYRTDPRYAVKSTDRYLTFPSRFDIPVGKTGVRMRFWTRVRRWARDPRVPNSGIAPHLNPAYWMPRLQGLIKEASRPSYDVCVIRDPCGVGI